MLKKIFVSIFLVLSLSAQASLQEKVENLIGYDEYQSHKNLINFIFKKEQNFYVGNNFNYLAILTKLKKNGLLKLTFGAPRDIEITFRTHNDPIKSLKILKETLKSLGFYYYFTRHTQYDGSNNLLWTITLKTEAAIDPLVFSNELLKHDCKVLDINREENGNWSYDINTQYSDIPEAVFVSSNEKVIFKKPLKPYFIKIKQAKSIYIVSRNLNKWLPYVVFYDTHLNILKVTKDDKVYRNLKLTIPESTRYIKITDLYTLFNIKRGLSITIKE